MKKLYKLLAIGLLLFQAIPALAITTVYYTSFDGYLNLDLSGSTWAAVHDGLNGDGSSDLGKLVEARAGAELISAGRWIISRAVLNFDTSNIGSGTVSAASFTFKEANGDHSAVVSDTINVVAQTITVATSTILKSDYASANWGTTSFGSILDTAITTENWFTIPFSNFTGINTTGISKLGLRFGKDISNTDPAGGRNYLGFSTWDEVGIADDPYLTVTYTCNPYVGPCTDAFATTTTWTAPTGVTSADVACWGGGGGGGIILNSGGGGGGGGAFASSTVAVTAGTVYNIVIGNGGAPDTVATVATSSFNGTTVVAAGGYGTTDETKGQPGRAAASTGTVKFDGGVGGLGLTTDDAGGGGGGGAGPNGAGGNGVDATATAGGGGGQGNNTLGGTGGIGGNNTVTVTGVGGDGTYNNLGGGGGGGGDNTFGGGKGAAFAAGGGGGEVADGGSADSGRGANGYCSVTYTGTLVKPFEILMGQKILQGQMKI